MRRSFQVIVFLLASIIEVQVKASSFVTVPEAKRPIEVPESCLIESSVCTVRTGPNERFTFEFGENEVVVAPTASFLRLSSQSGAILDGHVLVKATKPFTIDTPYGPIKLVNAEVLLFHSMRRITVQVLKGHAELYPRAMGLALTVKAGYENWIGRVDTKGVGTVGIPKAYDFKSVVFHLGPLHHGGKKSFESQLTELRESWHWAVTETSLLYGQMVQRAVAQENEREQQRVETEKRAHAEREHWRRFLWQKTFE